MKLTEGGLLIGFDFGLSNIGIAIGNRITNSATPLTSIKAIEGNPDWPTIGALIKEWKPTLGVIGNPLLLNGHPSEMTVRAKQFAKRLEGRFQLRTMLFDERFSSRAAKSTLRFYGDRRDFEQNPVDAEAAALILSSYLSEYS